LKFKFILNKLKFRDVTDWSRSHSQKESNTKLQLKKPSKKQLPLFGKTTQAGISLFMG
jgi:hypothetical protein